MLSRPATKLGLTVEDIAEYERRQAQRDTLKRQEGNAQNPEQTYGQTPDDTPAGQAKSRAKLTREQRLGLGSTRN
ncbi:hypothetical protein BST61_g3199 [Cercospora zeina]